MRVYIGFDDTDNALADRGTGKLARWFEKALPEGCRVEGVVRQQLLVHEQIPYTSHNSSACSIISTPDGSDLKVLIERAAAHLEQYSLEGSDPGLCVAWGKNGTLSDLIVFGRTCTSSIVTQKDAMKAASRFHLSGHGGTRDGIIGAAAAVGLTASGWSGRFIEYGGLRGFPDPVRVAELERSNMMVVSMERDATVPGGGDLVYTRGWLRPRLWGDKAVVPVTPVGEGVWESLGEKRKKANREQAG